MRKTMLWIICLTLVCPPVVAKEYYVAQTGKDNNPGTLDSPFKTISKAAETMVAGDTVYIRGGTYIERVKPPQSGNATDGYITFSNYQNEEVILRDTGLPVGYEDQVMIWIKDKNYIKLIGFHVDGHTGNGIRVDGPGDHIEIRNCIVSNQIYTSNVPHGQSHALLLFAWLEYSGPLQHIIVDNCEIHHNSTGQSGGYNEAFTIFGEVSHFQITNNYIHDNHYIGNDYIGIPEYMGTNFGVPTQGLIKGNIVENNGTKDTWSSGIYSDGSGYGEPDEIVCEENITFGNRFSGIELGDEHTDGVSGGWTVQRNISYDNGYYGLSLSSWGTQVTNTDIRNNVFYKNRIAEIAIDSEDISQAKFRNNIVIRNSTQVFIYWEGPTNSSINSDYNCWWPQNGEFQWNGASYRGLEEYQNGAGQDQHSIEENPLFVDADNFDFHLQSQSPCIDRGVDVGLPFAEKAPDIGAYEFGDVVACSEGQQRACYDGPAATQGIGICQAGSQQCEQGAWSACNGQLLPQTEVCDGQNDEDCDGTVDENCPCTNGEQRNCYQGPQNTAGIGICQSGTQTCHAGGWQNECVGQVLPATEVCQDSLDNNCDGQIDEGCELEDSFEGGCNSPGTSGLAPSWIFLFLIWFVGRLWRPRQVSLILHRRHPASRIRCLRPPPLSHKNQLDQQVQTNPEDSSSQSSLVR